MLPLDPRVQELQETYIRKVVDTVADQPNVLWEVANESSGGGKVDQEFAGYLGLDRVPEWGDSTEWQYWVIDTVKRHEEEQGYDPHPIGMTMQFPVPDQTKVNEPLYASRAEWISPGFEEPGFFPGNPEMPECGWFADPPPARREEGRDRRHRSHRAGRRRRALGLENVPPGPPSDPDGLRDHRRREPARSQGRRSTGVRELRAGAVRDG